MPTGDVTMVFTDIEGSTQLLERARDRYPELLATHHGILREVWSQHRGVEEGTEGDAFFVLFRDAADAVAATAAAQRRLAQHAWPAGMRVRVRMGVHTGHVERRDGNLWGADIHYTARLASAAHGGQVLLSASTAEVVETAVAPLGDHGFKDFPEPRPIFQLVVDGEGPEAFPPPRTLSRVPTNVPTPPDALIGRRRELDELAWAIVSERRRLLTLTGPGGSGKTRLAIALARRLLGNFPDGVFFVALDEVSDPGAVPSAVERSLALNDLRGVDALDRLTSHLAGRRVLLVLDNMEHLLDAAEVAHRLAHAGDGVAVIATSQARLGVAAEHVVLVAPLAEAPAVELLVERARDAAPGFALTSENDAAVRELCARLDGLPLALELAAQRLALVDPETLLRRLDDTLDALGTGGRAHPERHRGLRAVLEWTTGLLAADERATLARLSAFPGGFTVELAEAAFGDVLEELARLHAVGLVRRDGARLSMAPPVRRYAAELLEQGGESASAARAATAALARLAVAWEEGWSVRFARAAPVLNAEAANLLEALRWSRSAGERRLHAELAAAAGWWLVYSGRSDAAREHLPVARAAASGDAALGARLDDALGVGGPAAVDPDAPLRALAVWRELGDRRRLAAALSYAANLHAHFERIDAARATAEEGLSLARDLGDHELALVCEVQLARVAALVRAPADAARALERLLPEAPAGSTVRFQVVTHLADVQLADGRYADALVTFVDALRTIEPAGIPILELIQIDSMVVALAELGRDDDAAVALALSELLHGRYALPVLGVAEEYAAVEATLPRPVRASGRERAERIGAGAAAEWFRSLAAP